MIVNRIETLSAISYDYGDDVVTLSKKVLELPEFATWSGCVGNKHHYGKGGLQQHTWEVVTLCLKNCFFFEDIGHKVSKRELFLSALFHDVGKIWDYKPINSDMSEWEGTEHKRKIHHISRSGLYWSKCVNETGLCKDIEDDVLHSILSHHGQREWGSPVAPRSRVAWLLHLCDNLSARMDDCDRFDIIHPQKDMKTELKTGEQWCELFKVTMMDPDGWSPRSNFDTELITKEEFCKRIINCTTSLPYSPELEELVQNLNL